MDFLYGERETSYLAARDSRLGRAIERIGPIRREIDADLFSAVVHHILGQQRYRPRRRPPSGPDWSMPWGPSRRTV